MQGWPNVNFFAYILLQNINYLVVQLTPYAACATHLQITDQLNVSLYHTD